MQTITTIPARLARALTLALALACLTVGIAGLGAGAASAHEGTALSLRSGGSDDPAGDDNGGNRSGGDDRVVLTGSCSGTADWKLKVKTDDGRLEVEGEVDSSTAGQQWRWAVRHNGSVSDRGTATTGGRSGSFSVERTIVDIAGTDRVVFRAVHDGQTCRGVVNY
jgi:hypothetical protein